MLTKEQIMDIIPHRPPFLLVDEIVELTPGQSAVGTYTLTGDEWFLQGHFPGLPVMPGVLEVEALAQVGAVAILALPEFQGKIGYFGGIDKVRFKRKVVPGDVLRLEIVIEKIFRNVGFGSATATVDGEVAAKGKLTFAVQ